MNRIVVTFIVAAFMVTAVVLLLVDLPSGSLFWSAAQNSGHTLIFAILTLISLLALKLLKPAQFAFLTVCIIFSITIFGIAIEYIQGSMGREASISDVLLNTSGVAVGLLFYFAFSMRGTTSQLRWAAILLASGILFFNFRHPVRYAAASMLEPSLPILADFEHLGAGVKAIALRDATVEIVPGENIWTGNDSKVLKVEFKSGIWPGISLLEPHPDWSDYTNFVFEAVNPTPKPIEVVIRIHDAHHNNDVNDRFRRKLKIESGKQTISIPIEQVRRRLGLKQPNREIDISKIKGIIIFMSRAQSDSVVLFDNFHLEK